MKISIIIPFYNSEVYLERTFRSIYKQSVDYSNFEVICIDDCSKDSSFQIIKDFQKKYSNLHLFSHIENKKQGAARNLGLTKAKGEFIWFVDADDFIEDKALNKLLLKLDEYSPDILQFNAFKVFQDQTKDEGQFWDEEIVGITGIEYLEFEMREKYANRIVAVWSKVFKKDFLIDNNLFFKEGVFWEDVSYTLNAFIKANSIAYIPLNAYNYVLTQGSDMRSRYDGRKIADSIRFCIDVTIAVHENITNETLRHFIIEKYIATIIKYKAKIKEMSLDDFNEFEMILDGIDDKDVLYNYMSEEVYGWLIDKQVLIELYKA
ncbi:MAG: glycosyltransferase [Labilibaculum sp.]|nr:glycosyltransferase [Labilibaculum sp.]MBI9060144.1 glycosyltransferase [Labilibaculum sp.]